MGRTDNAIIMDNSAWKQKESDNVRNPNKFLMPRLWWPRKTLSKVPNAAL